MITLPMQQCLRLPERQAHMVQLYCDAEILAATVVQYVSAGLARGDGIVMILTTDHRLVFEDAMRRKGLCLDSIVKDGALVLLDAHATLASVCEDGIPDWHLITTQVGAIVDSLKNRFSQVRVYGEMVDILWQQKDANTAARLEALWNRLVKTYDFALLCAYQIDDTDPGAYAGPLHVICDSSSHLLDTSLSPGLDAAVDRALDKVLGQTIAKQIRDLVGSTPVRTKMNAGHAKLFFLADHMPNVTNRVLQELRAA